ncbi:MAG: cobyric acid synthase [Actinobacteria bacterium]|nr:cobyric acid synthase [Actinomycetota bacterium]MCL6095953.1 cobyric acid synthase [Actinomycetota bacterium]
MIAGTGSNVGKSQIVAGLCRLLARRGVSVAPFKAQNMALNSYVTPSGGEIGRAQAAQALAAGVEPEVTMNPVLLKPTSERTSQVIVMGKAIGHFDAASYHAMKQSLFGQVRNALADLRQRFDVVICEGAGSPAEINLLDSDIVNLRLAAEAGLASLIVGDIDRGGVFASLYGTVALLPESLRSGVRGFIINKLRGDPTLLGNGLEELELRTGIPTVAVLPYLHGLYMDGEDSLVLKDAFAWNRKQQAIELPDGFLDVAVINFPHISNFTDFDALFIEPEVHVRLVSHPASLGMPDLLILPGTKSTVSDLGWLRDTGLDQVIHGLLSAPGNRTTLLGICGGYQILGKEIHDRVENGDGEVHVEGLGLLDATTTFQAEKVVRQRKGLALGKSIEGYEIHHGIVRPLVSLEPFAVLHDRYGSGGEGIAVHERAIYGTNLHGLFDQDDFRRCFLAEVASRRGRSFRGGSTSFAEERIGQADVMADLLDSQLDFALLERIITEAERMGERV